jgi:hypothetical protein
MTALLTILSRQFEHGMAQLQSAQAAAMRVQNTVLLQRLANEDMATPNQCAELRCLASRD